MQQTFPVLWFTGLPCSGKTTLAKKMKEALSPSGIFIVNLDGDELRSTLNDDLGFSVKDRKENLRRAAHIARLLQVHGALVLASFVSPKEEYRLMVQEIVGDCICIYVKCSVDICKKRDVKGMYAKAQNKEILGFTGESSSFEEPHRPDIIIDTEKNGIEECVQQILEATRRILGCVLI